MSTNINPAVPSNNFRVGRNGWVPDLIVFHTSGNTTQSAINTITNPSSRVSYHFIIAANGHVTRAVDIANTAFANGTGSGNLSPALSTNHIVRSRTANANDYTISIAFGDMNLNGGHLTAAQIHAAAMQLNIIRADVFSRWNRWLDLNRTTIIGHNEVAPRYDGGGSRSCPLWNRAVPFPFTQIIQTLNGMPGLLRFHELSSMGEYVGMLYDKEEQSHDAGIEAAETYYEQ